MHYRRCLPILALLFGSAYASDPALISGVITDLDTGLPIAGATVAFGIGRFEITTTQTETDGSYSLTVDMLGQPDRSGFIEAAGPAHAPTRLGGEPLWDCHFSCGGGGLDEGLIELNPGQILAGQDLALPAGGRAGGTVSASDAGALANIRLEPISALTTTSYTDHFSATSAADGNWELPLALRPGDDFRLIARAPSGLNYAARAWNNRNCQNGVCTIVSADPVPIVGGVLGMGFDFVLAPGATLSGTLLPNDDWRLVSLFDAAGIQIDGRAIAAGQSNWQFDQLTGGSYYIQLGPLTGLNNLVRQLHNGLPCPFSGCQRARGAPVTVTAGDIRSGIDVVLAEGGSIRATIIDGDTGTAPDLVISSSNPSFLGTINIVDTAGEVVGGGPVQISDGNVVMPQSAALTPGSYFVRSFDTWGGAGVSYQRPFGNLTLLDGYSDAMHSDVACAGQSCDTSLATPVSVTQGETTEIVIEVVKGSMVSGQVVDDDTGLGMDRTMVELVDGSNRRLAGVTTDGNGNFDFGGFPAGTYYLRTAMSGLVGFGVRPVQHAYFDRVLGASGSCSEQLCDPTTGTPITLDGSTDAGPFELRVEPGPVIRGRVIDTLSGLEINDGRLDVFTSDGTLVGQYRIDPRTGIYQTTALPPGTYTLVPQISPAFVAAPLSADPAEFSMPRKSRAGRAAGFLVDLGDTDVDVSLGVVDRAQASIFADRFDDNAP